MIYAPAPVIFPTEGACLSIPIGKGHTFRALGNVSEIRGTISFWVRLGREPGEANANILNVEGADVYVRVRNKRVIGKAPGSDFSLSIPAKQWHHLAFVFDRYFGHKLYLDGKLQKPRWNPSQYGTDMDELHADLIYLACASNSGGESPVDIDELQIYSQPLGPAAVAKLAKNEPVTKQDAIEPPPDDAVFRQRRVGELGWASSDVFLRWTATTPFLLRKLGVLSSKEVKRSWLGPGDGIHWTGWPANYQGYEIPQRGLHLQIEPGARIDYLTLQGNFEGKAYPGTEITEPPAQKAILTLKSPGKFLGITLKEPLKLEKLSFFQPAGEVSEKMDAYGRIFSKPLTHINELCFYRIGDLPQPIPEAVPKTFHFTTEPFQPEDRWVKWTMLSHYEPLDRVSLILQSKPSAQSGAVRLRALRHAHFFIPPQGEEVPLAGLKLGLFTLGSSEPTLLRVQIHNPVDITRNLLNLDVKLVPGANNASSFEATLDLQDFIIPADQPLWITLTPEKPLDLAWDGGERASYVWILTRPREEVLIEHTRNMLEYAKDRFKLVSEARPWGNTALKLCGERRQCFRMLDAALEDLKRHAPEDDKVAALWTWTHPTEKTDTTLLKPLASDGAPKWALHAKEAMKKYRAVVNWWIDKRQLPNGLFGSGYADDSDLIHDWMCVAMTGDPGGKIRCSLRRIGDYCWNEGPIMKGINRVCQDTLHAYEEGTNIEADQALLYYGNPVYLERLMETSRTVRDYLTYTTPDGRRFFKSNEYGATHIYTEHQYGQDHPGNALMLHPTLGLAWYSRNPGAMKLLGEWFGSWCSMYQQVWETAGVKGKYPTAVAFPNGEVVATTNAYITGHGFLDACLGMYSMTREEKYFAPYRTWLERGSCSANSTTDLFAVRDMKPYHEAIRKSLTELNWTNLHPEMGDDPRQRLAYLGWLVTGDKTLIERASEDSWRRISVLFPMHTWAEQSADRVAISAEMVSRLYLGGTPGKRNKLWPTHTVSWERLTEEFAAWVLETTPERLRVWIYNFEQKEQSGVMRVWGLDNGTYEVKLGSDVNEDGTMDSETWARTLPLAKGASISITLPSRQLVLVEVAQKEKGQSIYERPDLAVTTTDMRYDTKERILTYVIHNVGSRPAANVAVTVRADGKEVTRKTITSLESPDDLMPRSVTFTQAVTSQVKEIEVTIDPEDSIPEIWKGNNRATFVLPQ